MALPEDTKRWVVVGCVLNTVLLPVLRQYIDLELQKLYSTLNQNQKLESQSYANRIRNDGGTYSFNYDSINQNSSIKKASNWKYSVANHHEFAKLYLKPFMAKFTKITDESFDTSAALSVMKCCLVFDQDLRDAADTVRDKVRNSWGHCNISEWNDQKFIDCFQKMEDLAVKLRNLPAVDKQKLLDEIAGWKNDGKLQSFALYTGRFNAVYLVS